MTPSERWLSAAWPFVRSRLPAPPARIVDVGCGPQGGFVPMLRAAGYDAEGIDPKAPEEPHYQPVEFEEAELPQKPDAFVASTSLHHVLDPAIVIDRMTSALSSGGVVVVVEWAWETFDTETAECVLRAPRPGRRAGWLHRRREEWLASEQEWPIFLRAWADGHGLHPGETVVRLLDERLERRYLGHGPYFFPNLADTTEAEEQAAIDAGRIRPMRIDYVGARSLVADFPKPGRSPKVRRVRRLAVALVVAFVLPAAAHAATPAAEIRDSDGVLLREIGVGAYTSPDDFGYLLTIGAARRDAGGLTLNDVSILGGRIRLARMTLPHRGRQARTSTACRSPASTCGRSRTPSCRSATAATRSSSSRPRFRAAWARTPGSSGSASSPTTGRSSSASLVRRRRAQSSHGSPFGLFGLAPIASVGGPSPFAGFVIPANGGIGARAVAIAEGYLGVPYVWGGATPEYGFDCSGLVMYVYAQLGIHLSHFSGAQWNEGTPIAAEDLAPGDLVFFHPGANGPGHVGIYIGGNNFIHAPHTGDVVKISSLYEYSTSYVGAVRPR